MLVKSSNVLHFMRLRCQCENPVYAGKYRGRFRGSNYCYEWGKSLNIDDFVRFKLLKIGRKSRVESGINTPLTVASSWKVGRLPCMKPKYCI